MVSFCLLLCRRLHIYLKVIHSGKIAEVFGEFVTEPTLALRTGNFTEKFKQAKSHPFSERENGWLCLWNVSENLVSQYTSGTDQIETLTVAAVPFEIVRQRPVEITADIRAIFDRAV